MKGIKTRAGFFGALAVILTLPLVLAGCLTDGEVVEEAASDEVDVRLTGSVGDGPIVGAAMRVLAKDGTLLKEFDSDTTAEYDVNVKTRGNDYPLFIDARNGLDLVTNTAPDFVLTGVVLSPSTQAVANLNPYSTLALEAARDMNGGVSKINIELAESIVATQLNFGLQSLLDSGPMATGIDAGNIAEIVRASEAVGELVRRTRYWLAIAGEGASGDQVLHRIASDLADGVIDGRGGARADARTAAIASIVAAQIALETVSNELHVNGVDGTGAMANAILQVTGTSSAQSLNDLSSTVAMLYQARIGLSAAAVVTGDNSVEDLLETTMELQPGIDASLAQALLPDDYRQQLDDALTYVSTGSSDTIETVNQTVRAGDLTPSTNLAPTISGTPVATAVVGRSYEFSPTVFDADGDRLTVSGPDLPGWLSLDTTTGFISGTPGDSDVGTYAALTLEVSDGMATATLGPFDITVNAAPDPNTPPTISGSPVGSATVGSAYNFTPTAADADGDTLVFSIQNLPVWASFDSTTGSMTGTPTSIDVNTYPGITIAVTDGSESVSLPAFSVTVNANGSSSVTLSWTAPTENEDGSPLTDLAGYNIYWGSGGNYPNVIPITNPGLTTYVVENLPTGTWEFVATAVNLAGEESIYSNIATKVVP